MLPTTLAYRPAQRNADVDVFCVGRVSDRIPARELITFECLVHVIVLLLQVFSVHRKWSIFYLRQPLLTGVAEPHQALPMCQLGFLGQGNQCHQ